MINSSIYGNFIMISFRGVFLVLLILMGSYLSPYLNCNFKLLLKKKPWIKHLGLLFIIYFTINLTRPNINKVQHPFFDIIKFFFIYLFFIIINSLHYFTIYVIIALLSLFLLTINYNIYLEDAFNENKDKNIFVYEGIIALETFLVLCIVFSIIYDFLKYKRFYNILQIFNLSRCNLNK